MKIGHFPYQPGGNPYQKLFADSLKNAGLEVIRIPPKKYFPLSNAVSHDVDLLQLDWPHDWYSGRNYVTRFIKRVMYKFGLARLHNIPCVWTAHNLYAHNVDSRDDEAAMIQLLINECDGIIVMSELAKKILFKHYDVRDCTCVNVIPHGHYIDVYQNTVTREIARERLNIEQNKKVILSLGRIQPYKGIDELIKQFNRIAGEDDVLLIAGKTSSIDDEKYLNDLIKNKSELADIRLHSKFIDDADLQLYFNAADIVALPFKNILNSGSVMLAMSFGKCIVAPKTGSIPEVVCAEGYFGYELGELDKLGETIRHALDTDNLREREKIVLDFTSRNYSWNDIGEKVKLMYVDVCSSI